jgi:predicted NBD/HSP70 family sugar kinase
MKDINVKLLLKNIYYAEEGVNRASLAKKTHLSPATVTNLVSELVAEGLIIETGNDISTGGRRPIILKINPNYKFVIGIKIGFGYINFMLSDLNGVVKEVIQKIYEELTVETVIKELRRQHDEWQEKYKVAFLGIGVAVSGVVDAINGKIINSYILNWKDIELSKLIHDEFDLDVQILNDVDSFAQAQLWKSEAKNYRNSAFLTLGVGIGGSVIINRQLLSSWGGVTEFGHMTVVENGNKCNCGSNGCLEAEASFRALTRKINKNVKNEALHSLYKMMKNNESSEIDFLEHAERTENAIFKEVFQEFSRLIGIVIKNVINIFNPEYFLIGGEAMEFEKYFLNDTIKFANKNTFNGLAEKIVFDRDKIGENAWTLGCIFKVIEQNILNSKKI